MKVLLITNRVPFPANSGYPIVIYNTIKGLLDEGAEVSVFSLNPSSNAVDIASLRDPLLEKIQFVSADINNKLSAWELVVNLFARKSFQISRFYKSVPVAKLKNFLSKNTFDLIQLEGLFVMPYLNLVRQNSRAKVIYRAHTIEHLVRGTTTAIEQSPLRKIYRHTMAKRLLRFELQNLDRTDAVLTINRSDKSHLESLGCKVQIENFPFTVNPNDYCPDSSKIEYPSLFHIGTMDSFPAIEGLEWFIRTVWKDLMALNTGLKFHLAGSGIPDDIYYLENEHLEIHDDLENAREFINSKAVMIIPLRTGSGMRVKIIEGMAMKKCIISTSMGAEGINYAHGKNILIADTPDEFYRYILQAVTDRQFCDEIGENARKLIEKEYNLKTGSSKLMDFYSLICGKSVEYFMKSTALTDLHISLGAKMVPFAGYNMPVIYSSINSEHEAVRTAVGVFDVSHMGEFILKGEHALDLIQKVSANDASRLFDGKVQYSYLPNLDGGVVDDLLVYRIDEKTYMLVVNASNIEKDWDWISKFNTFGVDMKNISDRTCLLAVQGPKAMEALQSLTDIDLSSMEYYSFKKGTFAGTDNVIVSATGYTGAGGFEIYADNSQALHLWNEIFKAGEPFGIKPIGLGARDTLRLEMGFCLYGNDIDDSTSPLEAGLGWVTKFTKNFNNSEYLLEQKQSGLKRKLVGFEMVERGIPRHDYLVTDSEGNTIGKVTSGTQSPSLQKAIGMAYVDLEYAKEGSEIFIPIRDSKIKAQVVKMPFFKK